MIETQPFVIDLGMGESPRRHEGGCRCNRDGREIVPVDVNGDREMIGPGPKIGGRCVDRRPEGPLLVTGAGEVPTAPRPCRQFGHVG
jgi:hypothetical protein